MTFPPLSRRSHPALLQAAGCLLIFLAGERQARAQDRLYLTDNTVQEGRVISVTGGTINLAVANGQVPVTLASVARADLPVPAAYQSGLAAYKAGSTDKALADLKPLADQFRGLPTDWVQQAVSLLGDLYIDKKDPARAEAAYNEFRQAYPRAPGLAARLSVGQARVAYAKNNVPLARQQLLAITQAAMKSPALVSALDGAAYGQAFYLLGQIQEKENTFQAALESYLRTVTLFYQDGVVAARAQKSADDLRQTHKEVNAP